MWVLPESDSRCVDLRDNNVKRKLAMVLGVLAALVVVAAAAFWYVMNKPLYEPGKLAASVSLAAVPQTGDGSYWEVEPGIRLRHFSEGSGRPVLFVHGGPGVPLRQPLAALEPLAERRQFVYYDQRGCGGSTRPIRKFTSSNYYENMKTLDRTLGLGAQIADIERVRRILGEQKLVLMGHSFGGFLAALYAAEFPERVAGLVLVAPASVLVLPAPEGDLFSTVGTRLPDSMKPEYDAYLKRMLDFGGIFSKSDQDLQAVNAEFAKYYRAVSKHPVFTDSDAGDVGGWMVEAMYMSMGQKHDYREALRRVKAPVLVIHGNEDLQPESASRTYVEAFPNAKLAVIRNAGHFVFNDQPVEFAAAAGAFLGSIE
jgi:proline iminopeptidase